MATCVITITNLRFHERQETYKSDEQLQATQEETPPSSTLAFALKGSINS
jgi:hypothetical protein